MALKTDGTLWAWGWNYYGQLGIGTFTDQNSPIKIGLNNNWASISTGEYCSLAIKTDGTLWSWGWNNYGQLGIGSLVDQNVPIQVGLDNNWVSISSGQYHNMAIKTDGTLWSWGWNGSGQLGIGTYIDQLIPIQVGVDNNWKMVDCGDNTSVAIKTDGTMWGCGYNFFGNIGDGTNIDHLIMTQAGVSNDWVSVSVGFYRSLAIKSDGTLWGFGENSAGSLGNSTYINAPIPTQSGTANNWQSISTYCQSIGIKTDATMLASGCNSYGQLGVGGTSNINIFTSTINNTNWASVSSGLTHTMAIKTDGTLWGWGNNNVGQLGIGNNTNKDVATIIDCPSLLCYGSSTVSLVSGLLAYYPFGGGSLQDYSGNGHDLTNITTAHPTADRNGNIDCAYNFTKANNEKLAIISPTFLDNLTTSPFSISLWYQPRGTRPIGDYEQLIGRDNTLHCPDTYGQWSLGLSDCRKVMVGFDMNSHWQTSTVSDCNTLLTSISNNWHHTAFVFDGTNYSLYVDGVLDVNTHGPCGFMSGNVGNFLLGKDYTGDLDDILIYNRALTTAEITQLKGLGSSCCAVTPLSILNPTPTVSTIKIVPNPSSSFITISTTEKIISTTITDLNGSKIKQFNSENNIDISSLNTGLYFVKVETTKGVFIKKMIKD